MLDTLIYFFSEYGYWAVFAMLLACGFGLPVPEDITLVAGGVISGFACPPSDHFWPSVASCRQVQLMFVISMVGVLAGDLTMLTFGRKVGRRITKYRWFRRLLPEKRFIQIQTRVEKYGAWIVFAARFMPGLRATIYVMTGITRRVGYVRFVLIDGMAALISVPVWIGVGFWGSQQREWLLRWIKKGQEGTFIIAGVIIAFVAINILVRWYIKSRTKKVNGD